MRVSQDVLSILDRAACEGNALSLTALGKLDRKLYLDTNKVLEAAGGKWNRKAGAHLFEGGAAEAIEPILLTSEIVSRKVDFQQFDTPPELAARVVAEARIEPGMRVLEPSAGLGALALPAAAAGGSVMCIEIDPKRAGALVKANAAAPARLDMVVALDFLKEGAARLYDRVVMNPPFAGQADIRHVLHAAKFLRPGGRLVAIMSASLTFRRNRLADEFRTFLTLHDASVVALPDDAFAASGTRVKTVLVSFDAPGGR